MVSPFVFFCCNLSFRSINCTFCWVRDVEQIVQHVRFWVVLLVQFIVIPYTHVWYVCEWSSIQNHSNWGYSRSRYELGNKRVITTHIVWDHLLSLWLTTVNRSWFIDLITCERVTMAGTGQGCETRFHSPSFSMLCFVMCDVGVVWGPWCCGRWCGCCCLLSNDCGVVCGVVLRVLVLQELFISCVLYDHFTFCIQALELQPPSTVTFRNHHLELPCRVVDSEYNERHFDNRFIG